MGTVESLIRAQRVSDDPVQAPIWQDGACDALCIAGAPALSPQEQQVAERALFGNMAHLWPAAVTRAAETGRKVRSAQRAADPLALAEWMLFDGR